jgi:hypothetical protein
MKVATVKARLSVSRIQANPQDVARTMIILLPQIICHIIEELITYYSVLDTQACPTRRPHNFMIRPTHVLNISKSIY